MGISSGNQALTRCASTVSFRQFNVSSSGNARSNLLLRRRVDGDVKRRQLTVLRYTKVRKASGAESATAITFVLLAP